VGEKLAGLGDFLVQSGRFLVVRKFIDLTLVQIFEFWRHKFEFGRYIFEFWRQIFEFWCQNQIIGYGGGGWAPQDLEVSSSVLVKKAPHTR